MHIDGNTIRIETAVPLAARLFGLPFLAMGVYVAYNLAMSVSEVLHGTGTAKEMIGGQLLMTVFMLSFGVPGATLVFGRRNVNIDRGRRSIGEVRKLSFFSLRTATVPLEDVKLVRATLRLDQDMLAGVKVPGVTDANQTGPGYDVELIDGKGVKVMLAGMFSGAADAVTFSKELARALPLPFEDHTVSDSGMGGGEETAP
jgi:hypothetical protein